MWIWISIVLALAFFAYFISDRFTFGKKKKPEVTEQEIDTKIDKEEAEAYLEDKKLPPNQIVSGKQHYKGFVKKCPACGDDWDSPKLHNKPFPHIAHKCQSASKNFGCGFEWTSDPLNSTAYSDNIDILKQDHDKDIKVLEGSVRNLLEEKASLKKELSLWNRPILKESKNYRTPASTESPTSKNSVTITTHYNVTSPKKK